MGLLESQQGSGPDTPFCAAVDGAFEIICLPNGFVKKNSIVYTHERQKLTGKMMNIHPIQGYLNHLGFVFFCFLSQ